MNADRLVLQNFFYMDLLDELIPFYHGKVADLSLSKYHDEVELVLDTSDVGDILPIREEFSCAVFKDNAIVQSTLRTLESYLRSHGVISIKIMPFSLQ